MWIKQVAAIGSQFSHLLTTWRQREFRRILSLAGSLIPLILPAIMSSILLSDKAQNLITYITHPLRSFQRLPQKLMFPAEHSSDTDSDATLQQRLGYTGGSQQDTEFSDPTHQSLFSKSSCSNCSQWTTFFQKWLHRLQWLCTTRFWCTSYPGQGQPAAWIFRPGEHNVNKLGIPSYTGV